MWGIRASRVGFVLAGVWAMVAATGCCCDCCKKLWNSDKPAPMPMPVTQSAGQVNGQPNAAVSTANGKAGDAGQPTHLTPERIKGGIC